MMLDSSHLELLAELTRNDTLAAASAEIHLSPSAASRRLREAERRVGFELATIDGRSMSLTAAGRILAEAAVATANQLSEAELAARWLGSDSTRPVTIGVEFYDSIAWALPRLDDYSFEVVRVAPGRMARALDRREIDIAIDVRQSAPDEAYLVADDTLVLVVPHSHELADQDRVGAGQVTANRYLAGALDPQPGFEFDSFFRPANSAPTNIVTVGSLACLLDLVAAGEGVSIQPNRVAANRADLRCIPLDRKLTVVWYATLGADPSAETSALSLTWPQRPELQ